MDRRKLVGQKTYWHLLDAKRMPTQYELVTSRLLYSAPPRGFEVDTPGARWYQRWRNESPFQCDDWQAFADPRETTYASYVECQRDAEIHVAGVLDAAEVADADRALPGEWIDVFDRVIAPLRYPCHGAMMLAAYIAQMAPAGRIVVTASMQAADEQRRVHRFAYRLAQMRRAHPQVGTAARAEWEGAPAWQPTRSFIERALVAYDWGESFAAVTLAFKPAWDELVCRQLAVTAQARGDVATGLLLRSLAADGAWHAAWSAELVRVACGSNPHNADVLRQWLELWSPRADAAVEALAHAFAISPGDALTAARDARARVLTACGLLGE